MINHLKKLAHYLYKINQSSKANQVRNIIRIASEDPSDSLLELMDEVFRIERMEKLDPGTAKEEAKELFYRITHMMNYLKNSRMTTNQYEQEFYQECIGHLNDFLIHFGAPEEKIFQGIILKENISPRLSKYFLKTINNKIPLQVDNNEELDHPLKPYINQEVYLKGSMRAHILHVEIGRAHV